MTLRAALLLLLTVATASACDRADPAGGMPLESAGKRLLQVRTLTQLLPSRKTSLAVDRLGQIYWVQESETHQDVLFMIGDGGIPRATRLTTANILGALAEAGDTAGDGAAGGNIRAITAGEGGVYFFFYGFKGNATKGCLGQYLPQSGRIRLLAATAALERASGMGRSMELARASLVTSDQTIYLWLRHSDVSVFFAFEPRSMTAAVPLELHLPFDKIVTEEGQALPLTRSECEMSPAPGGGLFLLDVTSALLWHVDRTGLAKARLPLIGLPKTVSPPTETADGKLLMFAPEGELIGTELQVISRQDLPKVQYPALLEVTNTQINAIPREDFRAHAGFPVYTLHLGRLVPETPGSYVSYDATSGALMRVKVVEQ